jgi:hypothetical protein
VEARCSSARRGRDAGSLSSYRFDALIEAPQDSGHMLDTRQLWIEAKGRPVHLGDLALANAARRSAGLPEDYAPVEAGVRAVTAETSDGSPSRSQYGLLRPTSLSRWRLHPTGSCWVEDPEPDRQLAPFLQARAYLL